MARDVAPIFAAIDEMDADRFVGYLTDDVVFQFANFDPAVGRDAVRQACLDFWATISGLTHHIRTVYHDGDVAIPQIDVEYVRQDGKHVTVPNADILTFEGDLVKDWRIFIDLAPVFA